MGTYQVRIARSKGHSSRSYAIEHARLAALRDGVEVYGEPTLRRKNKPLPLVGPHRAWIVTFDEATKTYGRRAASRNWLREAG